MRHCVSTASLIIHTKMKNMHKEKAEEIPEIEVENYEEI